MLTNKYQVIFLVIAFLLAATCAFVFENGLGKGVAQSGAIVWWGALFFIVLALFLKS